GGDRLAWARHRAPRGADRIAARLGLGGRALRAREPADDVAAARSGGGAEPGRHPRRAGRPPPLGRHGEAPRAAPSRHLLARPLRLGRGDDVSVLGPERLKRAVSTVADAASSSAVAAFSEAAAAHGLPRDDWTLELATALATWYPGLRAQIVRRPEDVV